MDILVYLFDKGLQTKEFILSGFISLSIFLVVTPIIIRKIFMGEPIVKLQVWGEGIKKPMVGKKTLAHKANTILGGIAFTLMYIIIIFSKTPEVQQFNDLLRTALDPFYSGIGYWETIVIGCVSLMLSLLPFSPILNKRKPLWISDKGIFIGNYFLLWRELEWIELESNCLRIRLKEAWQIYDTRIDTEQMQLIKSELNRKVSLKYDKFLSRP